MEKEFLGVYERPEAEEVKLTIESTILSQSNTEDPGCLNYDPNCNLQSDFCMTD